MRGIILTLYKILGPLVLLFILLGLFEEAGLVTINERTMPELLYTAVVMLTFALVFVSPFILIASLIVVWRYFRDWPVSLPAAMVLLSFLFVPLAFLWPDAPNAMVIAIMMIGSLGFALTATWAGWYSKRPVAY